MRSDRLEALDSCGLARRWVLAPLLAQNLIAMDNMAAEIFTSQGVRWPGLWIISGHRSATRQTRVNPDAPNSLHTRCPSLAADLRVGNLAASTTPDFWPFLGTLWKSLGGKWGGDFKPEPDVNHFQLLTVREGPVELSTRRAPQGFGGPVLRPTAVRLDREAPIRATTPLIPRVPVIAPAPI